jgi:transposase-like protein
VINEPGAVVAEVARCADECTSLVYKWRREARSAASEPSFAGNRGAAAADSVAGERTRAWRDLGGNEGREDSDRLERAVCVDRGDVEGATILIAIPSGSWVWIATGHTDMRRGMQGLALQFRRVSSAIRRPGSPTSSPVSQLILSIDWTSYCRGAGRRERQLLQPGLPDHAYQQGPPRHDHQVPSTDAPRLSPPITCQSRRVGGMVQTIC